MAKRLSVVVSQGQSNHPQKRGLEEEVVTALLMEPGIDVTVIPHLYDLTPDGTGVLALQGIGGNMVVLSWLFERGARWTLDRHGIHGQAGKTLLVSDEDEDDEEDDGDDQHQDDTAESKERVIDQRPVPARKIYCIDLRVQETAAPYVTEVKRIANENRAQVVELTGWLGGQPKSDAAERFLRPTNDTALGGLAPAGNGHGASSHGGNGHGAAHEPDAAPGQVMRIADVPDRRWYPVIDYSRCTNCMECIDFCLFGVYGVDRVETILVEQPDNCRKGCPACSRVCPENAIIFPQHKTPAIAGAAVDLGGLKIDLSRLFGAPDEGKSAVEKAVNERDEQLMLAGRNAVGMSVGVAPREEPASQPKDKLDRLIDQLDELDL